jgi:DnaA family protein
LRAKHRGLTLPDEVINYLLVRENRDMNNLYQLLDRLDKASLAARRKLTIPFIKKILEKSI